MDHQLRAIFRRAGCTQSDAELLARFRDDHAAFAELVARHGAMVWGVCRHLLVEADAEDAFQATYLALFRSTIRDGSALASWLHGVALRISLAARREAGRRRVREWIAAAPEMIQTAEPDDWENTMAAVHREVAHLPEGERSAFILCVLEGSTQAETAARLGRTPGAIAGQVARAKKRLVARLAERGVVPGLAALGTASTAGAVPLRLVEQTLRLPGGTVAPTVLRLARGLNMTALNTKVIAGVLMVVGLTAGVWAATPDPMPEAPSALSPSGVKPPDPTSVPPLKGPSEGAPKLTDGDTSKPIRSLLGHKDRVTSVAYSPDGRWIASVGWDGTARLWDAQTGKEVRKLDVPATRDYTPAHLLQIQFSPDNEFVVTAQQAAPNETGVIVWNRRTGEKMREFLGGLGNAAISPDGKLIACGAFSGVRLYGLADGKLVREIQGQISVRSKLLAFSPDGTTLVSGVRVPRPPLEGVTRLGFDPEVVHVWDVATGKERHSVLKGLSPEHLVLSPDGRTLAHASKADIILRETATRGERLKLAGHTNDLCVLAFSPDGRTLASGSMDGTVRLWDLRTGKEIGRFGKEVARHEGRGWMLAVAFSPDGRTLVSGSLDHIAQIWDVNKITGRAAMPAERSASELDTDWKDLAGDAVPGYAAVGRLVASPGTGIPFLDKRLQAAASADTKPIERLIGALDNEEFPVRERATKDLESLGDRAALSLRKALAGNPSPEAKQRLGALLARVDGAAPSAETVREIRAVEALESLGTPEARRVLETLAAGSAGLRLTQEAKAAIGRLTARTPGRP